MRTTRSATRGLAALGAVLLSLVPLQATAEPREVAGRGYTFGVTGDIPYGDAQVAAFPGVVDQLNADPALRLVAHLGDIKSGSTVCSDDYYARIRTQFDRFADPLVYTPGDNEWTDCHRPNNGAYDPLERLDTIRATFFDEPDRTLGRRPARVAGEDRAGYPENVRFRRADVSFASVHIVGSNNGLAPWTGATGPNPQQTAEVLGRTANTIEVIRDTFAEARQRRDRAVVLLTQADMFDPTVADPQFAGYYAFAPIVAAIAQEAAAYGGPVYLFNGDSHLYNEDRPLAPGSGWLSFYGVATAAPNLQRITVDGSTNADNYLRVTVSRSRDEPLRWVQVPLTF